MTHRIGNSEITVVRGDICRSECEVLVSSDNSRLSQGGGVSFAIARAGGEDIRRQIQSLVPVDLGDVAVTTAGNLPRKYVFHAVTIDLEQSRTIDEELQDFIVRNSVRRCFQLMGALQLSSIAFPVVGAGTARIPFDRAIRRMAETFAEELGKTNRGLSVELWLFDMPTEPADEILGKVANSNRESGGLLSSALIATAGGPAVSAGVLAGGAVGASIAGSLALPAMGMGVLASQMASRLAKTLFGGKQTEKHIGNAAGNPPGEENPDAGAHEVFISYSRRDGEQADRICSVLRAAGISHWRDVDGTYSGQNFKGVIVRAIRAAHTVLFLSSEDSNRSENVIGEVGVAVRFGKHVVPVKLDNAEYHDDLLLDLLNLDYIDVNHLGWEKAAGKIRKVVALNRANAQNS